MKKAITLKVDYEKLNWEKKQSIGLVVSKMFELAFMNNALSLDVLSWRIIEIARVLNVISNDDYNAIEEDFNSESHPIQKSWLLLTYLCEIFVKFVEHGYLTPKVIEIGLFEGRRDLEEEKEAEDGGNAVFKSDDY